MLEVIEGAVTHNGIQYIEGEVIDELTADEEERLVSLRVCRVVDTTPPRRAKASRSKNTPDSIGLNLQLDPDELIKGSAKEHQK
jgi:hypothetical protein